MLVISPSDLSDDALIGVIDAFVLREGTDYGHSDISLQDKRAAVLRQLQNGEAQICYYPESEHIDIVLPGK